MNQLQLPLSTMPERQAEYYARLFGLPPDRMKRLCDLEEAQIVRVNYHFGLINAANYIYAIKSDGDIVSRREKRNLLIERNEE